MRSKGTITRINATKKHTRSQRGDFLKKDIPSFLEFMGFKILFTYPNQPKSCPICGLFNHEAYEYQTKRGTYAHPVPKKSIMVTPGPSNQVDDESHGTTKITHHDHQKTPIDEVNFPPLTPRGRKIHLSFPTSLL